MYCRLRNRKSRFSLQVWRHLAVFPPNIGYPFNPPASVPLRKMNARAIVIRLHLGIEDTLLDQPIQHRRCPPPYSYVALENARVVAANHRARLAELLPALALADRHVAKAILRPRRPRIRSTNRAFPAPVSVPSPISPATLRSSPRTAPSRLLNSALASTHSRFRARGDHASGRFTHARCFLITDPIC